MNLNVANSPIFNKVSFFLIIQLPKALDRKRLYTIDFQDIRLDINFSRFVLENTTTIGGSKKLFED